MHTINEHRARRCSILAHALACVFVVAAAGAYCESASAQQLPPPRHATYAITASLPSADLEKAFWACDYTATTRGVYAAPIELCSAVTDELKEQRFNGDFGQMLEWWQQNKPAEHAKLASGNW
jgi:hypothetical protein